MWHCEFGPQEDILEKQTQVDEVDLHNVAKCNLHVGWQAVSPRVLEQGGWGICAGAPHGMQLGLGCQVIYVCYCCWIVRTVIYC